MAFQQLIIRLSYCNRLRLRKKTQSKTIVHKKQYVSTSWKYYHSSRTSLLVEKYDNLSLKKTTTSFNPCRSFFTVRFDGYFFTIKNHLRADDYATTVCAIKSTQLKQGRTTRRVFLNTRTYQSLFGKRFNLCRSQNDVQNTKAFSQQTIHAQIKRSTAWIRPHSFWHRV